MGGIRIEGSSGNVADATSAGNLKVQLPTTAAQVGSVRLMSENDDGSILGTPQLRAPETGVDYRLRVGSDTLLDSHYFTEDYLHINKHNVWTSGSAVNANSGYVRLNSSGQTNANAYAMIHTLHHFQMVNGNGPMYVETAFRMDAAIVTGVNFEWGMASRNYSTASTPDGVFFRLTTAGLVGVISYSGSQTTTGVMLSTLASGVTYTTGIIIGNRQVEFYVNDVMYVEPLAFNTAMPLKVTTAAWFAKFYHGSSGSTGAAGSIGLIGGYAIYQNDIVVPYQMPVLASIMGNGMYMMQGSQGANQNFSVSTAPPSITLTANSGPGLGKLFNSFIYPSAITVAESDYPIVAYIPNPTGISDTLPPKNFVCTGVEVGDLVVTSAVSGGPLVAQWFVGFKCTSSTLNVTESTQWGGGTSIVRTPRMIPMRCQTIPASASAGTVIGGFRLDLSSSPLLIGPQDYLHVVVRFPAGTSITSSSMRQTISLLGYHL